MWYDSNVNLDVSTWGLSNSSVPPVYLDDKLKSGLVKLYVSGSGLLRLDKNPLRPNPPFVANFLFFLFFLPNLKLLPKFKGGVVVLWFCSTGNPTIPAPETVNIDAEVKFDINGLWISRTRILGSW